MATRFLFASLFASSCAASFASRPAGVGTTLSSADAALQARGFHNIPYVYECYGSSQINDVVSQSPGSGTSYGKPQPVSLKLQAQNC